MPKTLPVHVYRNAAFGDCSNHGRSEEYVTLFLICEDGWKDVPEDSPRLLRLVSRHLFEGKPAYLHVEPVNPGDLEDKVGPMFGGNFVYSSDSRFPSDYPIPVHDRYEEVEIYEAQFH